MGVEAARSQDLETMNEHDAAAHLAALRNPLRSACVLLLQSSADLSMIYHCRADLISLNISI